MRSHFQSSRSKAGPAVWRSGVGATVFGSVLFMDNLLTNWARPFIVNEGRFVYAHKPTTEANWISLDDVARIMIHSLDRPDMEGAWMNIGGPERLRPPQLASALTNALGREVTYDACTPAEFGRHLVNAYGDEMDVEERETMAKGIGDFYEYNVNAPTRPFEVDTDSDNQITLAELQTKFDTIFTRLDKNNDGVLVRSELLTIRADVNRGFDPRRGKKGAQ